MHTNEHEDAVIEATIGAAYDVSNVLGCGFLEKLYERAMLKELAIRGVMARSRVALPVSYKGQLIGDDIADLIVDDKIIVELKCVDHLGSEPWRKRSIT
jgi:GxxExxY protein